MGHGYEASGHGSESKREGDLRGMQVTRAQDFVVTKNNKYYNAQRSRTLMGAVGLASHWGGAAFTVIYSSVLAFTCH